MRKYEGHLSTAVGGEKLMDLEMGRLERAKIGADRKKDWRTGSVISLLVLWRLRSWLHYSS